MLIKISALTSIALISSLVLPASASAQGSTITVSKKDCQRLVRHTPAPDVAYKPGVDVRGKAVAGADLGGGSQIRLPKEISFNIGIDLAEKYGLDEKGISASQSLGQVTVRGDRVYWNDQPLGNREQGAIAQACQQTYSR